MARKSIHVSIDRKPGQESVVLLRPESIDDVIEIMQDRKQYPSPVRAVGSNSGSTRNAQTKGTLLDMTAMKKFIRLTGDTATVGAGMQLRSLAVRLAGQGLELVGGYEYPERTVGGLISSGSLSSGIPGDAGHLASSVTAVTIVTPQGGQVEIGKDMPAMLRMVLQGYGLFGIICSVTLKIRPIRMYAMRNREFGFDELIRFIPDISGVRAGVKIFLLPFRNRAFVELRFADSGGQQSKMLPWKIRDWACNKVIPDFVHSVGKMVSIRKIRDPLIDSFSELTQRLVNKRLSVIGSNAMEQTGQFRKLRQSTSITYSTWLFPDGQFASIIYAYREFCLRHYKVEGFRCDLPGIAYRIERDQSALLSPSYDQPLFALKLRSTNLDGWENFLLDFADLAARFGGIPLFNQTRGMSPQHAQEAYGQRLDRFRKVRRELDPYNRCLNQFFAEYIG
jgi:FAD/FMN-containing dehydrogenase